MESDFEDSIDGFDTIKPGNFFALVFGSGFVFDRDFGDTNALFENLTCDFGFKFKLQGAEA